MINFRYHVVSLMAVFIALAVGIAVGVSLSPSLTKELQQQANDDRQQVTVLRAEIDRLKALDQYRDDYEARVGKEVTTGLLTGERVAVVTMPEAPTAVVQAVNAAVADAGGTVVRQVKINSSAFGADAPTKIEAAVAGFEQLGLTDAMSPATKLGIALGRSIAARQLEDRDAYAVSLGKSLSGAGLVSIDGSAPGQAQLIIVVTEVATSPAPDPALLTAHVQLDVGLHGRAGVVLAGPNSTGLTGTDVLTARTDSNASDTLSTVDVADLASGVTTVVLAGKEQLLGRTPGHYGALTKADAPAPTLPVR